MFISDTISINDYDYDLPEKSIAKFPLEKRDESKLLLLNDEGISTHVFRDIPDLLPKDSLLIFNNTKVIFARILFRKPSGSLIEIFCLEPAGDIRDAQLSFQQKGVSTWKCFIGNNKRWKEDYQEKVFNYQDKTITLKAERKEAVEDAWIVEFSWNEPTLSFAEVLELIGIIPLPPYLNRNAVDSDKIRYQTIYARMKGSVAAPTAGLHFTNEVFNRLKKERINVDYVTLHVGAGTFKPVSTEDATEHIMHHEKIIIEKQTIVNIIDNLNNKIIAVGTTSARTLESLYWFGVKLKVDKDACTSFNISQWDAYAKAYNKNISTTIALQNVISYIDKNNLHTLYGDTQLMIVPGYKFRVITGIITNFHQPKSTLLLLIAAFIGKQWKDAYAYALANGFRFLSYGDSCLFLKE